MEWSSMARAVLRTSCQHKQVSDHCDLGTPHINLVLLIMSRCPSVSVLWCSFSSPHSSQDATGKTMDSATHARDSCRV